MTNYIINISKYIIYIGFAALFFVTPFIMTPINSELFEFNKMLFVYGVTIIVLAAWLVKALFSGEHVQGSRLRRGFGGQASPEASSGSRSKHRELKGQGGSKGDKGDLTPSVIVNSGFQSQAIYFVKSLALKRTPLDIPIFFFLVSQIVATIFSIDPYVSIWGYYSRQNGGLLSTVSYIVLFYAFVSNIGGIRGDQGNEGKRGDKRQAIHFMKRGDKRQAIHFMKRLALLGIASGFLVAVYGILQHFGIDKDIWVQDVVNRVFSTLGQPNWLAAYMAVLAMVALGLGIGEIGNRGDRGDKRQAIHFMKRGDKRQAIHFMKRLALVGLVGVFYLTILYTKSRSGLLGFWVGNAVFWSLVGISRIRRIGHIRRFFLTFNFALLTLNFIFGVPLEKFNQFMLPGILTRVGQEKVERIVIDQGNQGERGKQGIAIESGGTESGEIRKYVWQAAWQAAKKNPLFGTGVETFAWAFYRYKPVEHNLTSEWDFLYNKAHNEYLNYAATTGFVGLGTYLLVIGVFGIWVFREFRGFRDKKKPELRITNYELLSIGLFAAWVSILVTNFFGFSVVVTSLYFWLIPAFIFAYGELSTPNQSEHGSGQAVDPEPERARFGAGRRPSTSGDIGPIRSIGLIGIGTGGIVVLAAVYLLFILGKYWYADVLYARGKQYREAGYTLQSNRVFTYAVELRPGEPIFWDELGFLEGMSAIEAADRREATHAAGLAASALDHQGKALQISPRNLNFIKTRAKLYYALSEIFDDDSTPGVGDPLPDAPSVSGTGRETPGVKLLDLAIKTLESGRELAPNDPKILYNLALLQADEGDSTPDVGVGGAIDTLREALDLKPDYRDARIALGLFYQEEEELEKAREQFEYILEKINPEDEEAQSYLNEL